MEVTFVDKILTEEDSLKEDSKDTTSLETTIRFSPPPPAPLSAVWSCPACTFQNESSSHRCGMCDTVNPNRNLSMDDDIIEAQDNQQTTPSDFPVWMCGQCTFMNQIESMR
jgi:hypothetical protein